MKGMFNMGKKYVYLFSEGNAQMRDILGGKGANLAEMTNIGLPVPQGFTVSTEACTRYYEDGGIIAQDILDEIAQYVSKTEEITGKKFGDPANPLLVSVRSGSRASMPGMMDTILNLGLNREVAEGLAALTGNERFAYDSYRRFIQMFSDVVMGLPKSSFEKIIDQIKAEKGVKADTELTAADMRRLTDEFLAHYRQSMGKEFPTDARVQLIEAVKAVFRSWNNERAIVYRRMNDIPSSWGTAVNVQAMVFGNMGDTSGTGVAFTRDPATGENRLYGEFLMNAQGEDVVAGIRTPQPISALKEVMPEVYTRFTEIASTLEKHYRDMQDMEFTIENRKLYMLQTRNGKRTAAAALKIAVDLVAEGLLSTDEALLKVEPRQLDTLLHPQFDAKALAAAKPAAAGLPASPGAAAGRVRFTAKAAAARGEKTVLVRLETSPEDIEGMYASEGILTVRGGRTSHAAVVARGMGRCCVAGCGDIQINEQEKCFTVDGRTVREGDSISIDGTTGFVYIGEIATAPATIAGDFETFMKWADEKRTLRVRTNADTPKDAQQAIAFGAEGVGLCRTEHMFFEGDRIDAVRQMILATDPSERQKALDKLLPYQRKDFEGIFKAMDGLPVTVRLLDPPLHEFLPHESSARAQLAEKMNVSPEIVAERCKALEEQNPMLGHRGCRLGNSFPEITRMQARAIFEAAANVMKGKKPVKVKVEIMVPLVGFVQELKFQAQNIREVAEEVMKQKKVKIDYMLGTMIEVPRGALTADEIAEVAQFFSFGTNDLTQTGLGMSRDDSGSFLGRYKELDILPKNPFASIDVDGVGQLVRIGVEKGRSTRKDIKLGVCGEHGGDPDSITFFNDVGLNYVSCSPPRVPVARLAAAQAALKSAEKAKAKK